MCLNKNIFSDIFFYFILIGKDRVKFGLFGLVENYFFIFKYSYFKS